MRRNVRVWRTNSYFRFWYRLKYENNLTPRIPYEAMIPVQSVKKEISPNEKKFKL